MSILSYKLEKIIFKQLKRKISKYIVPNLMEGYSGKYFVEKKPPSRTFYYYWETLYLIVIYTKAPLKAIYQCTKLTLPSVPETEK